jgi:hypothetical protein
MAALLALTLVAGCAGGPSTETWEPVGTGRPVATGEPVGTGESSLTAREIATLTGDSQVDIPEDAPAPIITAEEAEAFVRQRFPGERQTLAVVRIAMRPKNTTQVGWFVGLTPAAGVSCSFNPGFLDRPIEGGIVSDQLLERIWIFGCPESL